MSIPHIALTVTPTTNVQNRRIINTDLMKVINLHWYDVVDIYNERDLLDTTITAHSLSTTDHQLKHEGESYKIIHFFSGPEDTAGPNGTYTLNKKKEVEH